MEPPKHLLLHPQKTELFCGSFLRKGEVLAYVGRIHNLKDLKEFLQVPSTKDLQKGEVFAYVGLSQNLKDLKVQ